MTAAPAYAFHSFPSPIPVEHRRLVHVRCCNMSTGRANYSLWASRIDNLIADRLDRKSLIHTTSYDRAQRFLSLSRFKGSGILLSHGQGSRTMDQVVAEFKAASPPVVLVSPSLVRGVSFDYDQCRLAIIGKLPWPDTRSVLYQRRKELDPQWPAYQAMQLLEQECGRVVRAADDAAEIVITDDAVVWFMRQYRHLASPAFLESWQAGGSVNGLSPMKLEGLRAA